MSQARRPSVPAISARAVSVMPLSCQLEKPSFSSTPSLADRSAIVENQAAREELQLAVSWSTPFGSR